VNLQELYEINARQPGALVAGCIASPAASGPLHANIWRAEIDAQEDEEGDDPCNDGRAGRDK
jgi:hypothetical protein